MKELVSIRGEMSEALNIKIWEGITQVLRLRVMDEFEDYHRWFMCDGDIWNEIATNIVQNIIFPIELHFKSAMKEQK